MRKTFFLVLAAVCCLWIFSTGALAAPFCVESQGLPAECWFHDVVSCRQEAAKRNGHCSLNQDEVKISDQGAPFCIIDAGMVPVCAFEGGDTCDQEAAKRNAVCFQNTGGKSNDDPYRFERMPLRQQ